MRTNSKDGAVTKEDPAHVFGWVVVGVAWEVGHLGLGDHHEASVQGTGTDTVVCGRMKGDGAGVSLVVAMLCGIRAVLWLTKTTQRAWGRDGVQRHGQGGSGLGCPVSSTPTLCSKRVQCRGRRCESRAQGDTPGDTTRACTA